jgi:hypothetical protein
MSAFGGDGWSELRRMGRVSPLHCRSHTVSLLMWNSTVGSRKAGIYKILCWSPGAPNRKLPDTILCRGLATTRKVIDKGLDHSLQTKVRSNS